MLRVSGSENPSPGAETYEDQQRSLRTLAFFKNINQVFCVTLEFWYVEKTEHYKAWLSTVNLFIFRSYPKNEKCTVSFQPSSCKIEVFFTHIKHQTCTWEKNHTLKQQMHPQPWSFSQESCAKALRRLRTRTQKPAQPATNTHLNGIAEICTCWGCHHGEESCASPNV